MLNSKSLQLARKSQNYFSLLIFCIISIAVFSGCGFEPEIPEIEIQDPQTSYNFDTETLSGYEIAYEPLLWNDGGTIQFSTNCYAYMWDMRTGFPDGHKLQPGELSGQGLTSVSVDAIIDAVEADAESEDRVFSSTDYEETCPEETYKVALVVDPGVDYHWYRQNPDGTWSHKPGHTEVTQIDASDDVIYNPQDADRDYGFINYSDFGGYFCTGTP